MLLWIWYIYQLVCSQTTSGMGPGPVDPLAPSYATIFFCPERLTISKTHQQQPLERMLERNERVITFSLYQMKENRKYCIKRYVSCSKEMNKGIAAYHWDCQSCIAAWEYDWLIPSWALLSKNTKCQQVGEPTHKTLAIRITVLNGFAFDWKLSRITYKTNASEAKRTC